MYNQIILNLKYQNVLPMHSVHELNTKSLENIDRFFKKFFKTLSKYSGDYEYKVMKNNYKKLVEDYNLISKSLFAKKAKKTPFL